MIVQTVKFQSRKSEAEVIEAAISRIDAYKAVPGLLQKYYVKYDEPDTYGGILIWESPEAMANFRTTELAAGIPGAYAVVEAPEVGACKSMFMLRH